jgi:adenosylhomocysteine nucleosidase
MAEAETSFEGWVPEPGAGIGLPRVVDLAFDYRGNTTVVKRDGSEVNGYIFNRNADAAEPFIQMFDVSGAGPFTISYSEIATIKFSGRDPAAGNSYAAWLRRKAAEQAQAGASARNKRTRRVLVLTALEEEARALARGLGLARMRSTRWPHYATPRFPGRIPPRAGPSSRDRATAPDGSGPEHRTPTHEHPDRAELEVMPLGLRAALLASRWDVGGPAPDLVVSAGLCGALAPALAAGDLLLPRVVLDDAGASVPVDGPAHAEALDAVRRAGVPVDIGPLVTVTDVVPTPEAKALLRRNSGATAVDLESAAVLHAARDRGIPAVVIRAVSDTARQSLPQALTRVIDVTGRVRPLSAAALALRRPSLLSDALALHRSTRIGLERVAGVLRSLGCPTR